MTSGTPDPTVDDRLDAFIAAWHAGQVPSAAAHLAAAPEEQREELGALIAAFVELAPTVAPTEEAAEARAGDPLVARLTAIEGDWWEARDPFAAAPWGARLRRLREAAQLTPQQVAAHLATRFTLSGDDAGRAPAVIEALEAGTLPSSGVAARAARALEQLFDAPAGVLLRGAAPPLGSPVLRGELPGSADDRARLAELLRTVDDALGGTESARGAERLHDLLGG